MSDSDGASTPAQGTDAADAADATPPRRWRAASVVAGGLAISAAVHLALVATALVMGSWGRPLELPEKAVPVDIVTPDQLAEMSAKPDPKPDPKPDSKPDAKPDTKPDSPPSAPPVPNTAAQQPMLPPSQPVAPPSPPPRRDAFALPLAPPPAPSAASAPSVPPVPSEPSVGPAEQMARLLGLPKPIAGLSGGPPSDVKANLTADEIARFAAHVQSCWTPLPASVKAAKITVFIRVRLRRDGSFAGDPEPLGGSASMAALTLLKGSLEALKRCPAYTALPADKYDEWRVLDLHFTPNGISTAAPAPHARKSARPG